MSEASSSHDVVEITVQLRGLTITVSGPAAQASGFITEITEVALSSPVRSNESAGSAAYPARSPAASTSGAVETREEIAASFGPCPQRLVQLAAKLGGSDESGVSRVRRASRAGQWAGAVLSGRVGSPNLSEQIGLRPRCYVVLKSDRISSPRVVFSSTAYLDLVGDLRDSSSVSHSFPSETEAKIYCAGAGVPYPDAQTQEQ